MHLAFLDRLNDEVLILMRRAAGRMVRVRMSRPAQFRGVARLCHARENLRITSRLTEITAWILAQKAVAVGELAREDLPDRYGPFFANTICLVDADGEEGCEAIPMPEELGRLREESLRLYERVARIEQAIMH